MACALTLLGRLHPTPSAFRSAASSVSFKEYGDNFSQTNTKRTERSLSTTLLTKTETPFPQHADVVIAGAGAVGCSVAYHLAKRGWNDVVLLEQGQISCGTTHHSVALLGNLKPTVTESRVAQKSIELYRQLEAEGYPCGLKNCGGIHVASTDDRMVVYKRLVSTAKAIGLDCHLLGPRDVVDIHPNFADGSVRTSDLKGGIWIPGDYVGTAPDICSALARAARDKGVTIFERCQVNQINTKTLRNDLSRVSSVDTSKGTIECEHFVNCSGLWSRELGKKSKPKVKVPLQACEHYYLVTKAINGIDPMLPVIRDPDGYIYIREWNGGLMVGGFEPVAKPVFVDGIPEKFEFQLLPNDWDHFHILLDKMLHRLPCLGEAEVKQLINGPESFTPDGRWILGETPEIENYFVAAGMHSTGITG
jgi:pyruvate dehydrogenase phosphatase regulatory subunit